MMCPEITTAASLPTCAQSRANGARFRTLQRTSSPPFQGGDSDIAVLGDDAGVVAARLSLHTRSNTSDASTPEGQKHPCLKATRLLASSP